MKQIGAAVVGVGWCGGIRAETLASHPLVKELHLAEVREDRLEEMEAKTRPTTASTDYRRLLERKGIDAVYISATPENLHFPMAKEFLQAGKHVFLEKPIVSLSSFCFASFINSSASSSVTAIGFSRNTCLPACRNSFAIGKCRFSGVAEM